MIIFLSFVIINNIQLLKKNKNNYLVSILQTLFIILQTGSNIKQMTINLAEIMNTHYSNIHIVCLAKGLIYPDDQKIDRIPRPLEVMVGNLDRKIPPNFETSLPDMVSKDESDPRVKMSCGHAISK